MTDHEAKARSIVKKHDLSAHYVIGGCGDACKCNAGFCELAVSAIASALREAEARATLAEREAWQARMKTASDMLAQMEAAGITQETRNELIGCLDPKILRSNDDIAEMEAQFAAAIRSRNDE